MPAKKLFSRHLLALRQNPLPCPLACSHLWYTVAELRLVACVLVTGVIFVVDYSHNLAHRQNLARECQKHTLHVPTFFRIHLWYHCYPIEKLCLQHPHPLPHKNAHLFSLPNPFPPPSLPSFSPLSASLWYACLCVVPVSVSLSSLCDISSLYPPPHPSAVYSLSVTLFLSLRTTACPAARLPVSPSLPSLPFSVSSSTPLLPSPVLFFCSLLCVPFSPSY